jgi:HD-GYP domain-containing protein (c-di-GMP phosphodiesterase class II)
LSGEPAAAAPPVAAELIRRLFVAMKAATVYGRENDGYRKHAAEARETLATALAEEGPVRLEARGDRLFFNGEPVRLQSGYYAGARFLMDEMKRRGVGALEVAAERGPEQLDEFVFAFLLRSAAPSDFADLEKRLAAAKIDAISVRPPLPSAPEASAPVDSAQLAKKAFFRAVGVVEEIMTHARDGRGVDFARAKRVVHGLADRVIEDEQALFVLSTIHDFDAYTYAHCVNVSIYSIAIGVRLGLERGLLSELGFSALFHDIGKTRLPLALIDKPDEYDEEDWKRMRLHPALGVKALLAMDHPLDRGLCRAASVAFEHHLGADGAGYPRTRRPRRQEAFSRVCAIADAFDAMTSGRVYAKRPTAPDEALRRIVQRAGTGFDPYLIRLFINCVGVFPIGTVMLLDDGRMGVVSRNDPENLTAPRLRVFADAGGRLAAARTVDLGRPDPATGAPPRIRKLLDAAALGVDVGEFLDESSAASA